ncbi:MAG: peptidase [Chloroflexi bacterium]|nr:MAG: peptidase [Chloroflexota bacterium]
MTMGIVLTTGEQMEIVVHDDAVAMAKLLKLPVEKRLGALAAMRGVSEFDEAAMKHLRQIHERGDGFRVGVDDPRYAGALARLVEADAWGQVKRELARAWEYQRAVLPGIHHAETVDVVLTLGNPDDTIFMERTLGYYGMGAIPGSIWMVAWPTDYNVSRIGACGVHELAHNLRTPNVEGHFDLAEWVIQEGLAEVFTVEVCGADSTGRWYSSVKDKVLEATWQKVTAAFGTGHSFPDWTPYVLGDEVAGRMGLRPAGVPHMGGYAVGRAIVERYLAATGLKAAQAIVRPKSEILKAAGITLKDKS